MLEPEDHPSIYVPDNDDGGDDDDDEEEEEEGATTPPSAADLVSIIPSDEIELVLLLVSGKRQPFRFGRSVTVDEVKLRVFEDWPKEWNEEKPETVDALKIVYLGRFLDEHSTLEANKIIPGKSTIVHLTIKLRPPSRSSTTKKGEMEPKCCACTIL